VATDWGNAVRYNGLGRYDDALVAAERAAGDPRGLGTPMWLLADLVEAAARSGKPERAVGPLERLTEIAEANGSDWALGFLARSRALLGEGQAAERLYREAIDRLGRTLIRVAHARTLLVYGEWLRRENRRVDAREQLRAAHATLSDIGMEVFAERARRELLATGETVRKRTVETLDNLTPQELQIAQRAAEGRTNPEIGAQLFLSPRTVEWHLRKVFGKLGISSRRQLGSALPDASPAAVLL
jgi:DNA-binding CsgD family transcriptional regulator